MIPAPYQGFKLATGRWVGGSQMMGNPAPVGLIAEVIARGPLFAEARLTYAYPDERTYSLTCRIIAGEAVALFSESFNTEKGKSYHRNLNYDFKRFVQGRFGYADTFENSHWVRMSLGDFQPEIERGDPWYGTLHPWTSWHGGMLTIPLANTTEYLGLMALRAGHWTRPLENLPLVKLHGDELLLQLPINDGRREWGMHFGAPDAAKPTGEERPSRAFPGLDHPSALQQAHTKYGDISLEVVKEWMLAWSDVRPTPNPVSINPPGNLAEVRQRIADDPLLAQRAKEHTAFWDGQRATKGFPLIGNWVMTPEGAEDVYLASGTAQHARDLFTLTLARLRYYTEQTLGGVGFTGYRNGHSYGMFHLAHFLIGVARQADLLLGSPHLTADEKAALRAQLAFYAYLFTDQDYWPPNEIGKGTYNMYASRDGAVGCLGAVLVGHPRAVAWQTVGAERVEDVLNNFIYPSGAMLEGMHYSGVTLDFILPFVSMLKLAGGKDYFTDERLKKGLRWYASCLPPTDVRFGRAYMPPFGYSHPSNTSQSVRWAVAAVMTANTDPAFSALMMRVWRQQGMPMNMVGGEAGYRSAFFLGMVNPALPAATPTDLVSAKWDGFGAVLRSHPASPLETFLAIPTGVPGGFRAYPNEGAFHLYAKGAPLCLRFGTRSFSVIGTMQAWMSNRITFDRRDECTNDTGKITAWASLPAADLFTGEYRFTRLAARAPLTEKEPGRMELSEPRVVNTKLAVGEGNGFFGDQQDVPPQLWRRQLLFAKDTDPLGPHYLLVRDSFQASLPTDWNLWCLATDLRINGDTATFTGKYEVDLDVLMADAPDKIVTGAWGPDTAQFYERQKLLQMQQGINNGYFALLYPRKRDAEPVPVLRRALDGAGVAVTLPDRADWAILAVDPVTVKEGEVAFTGRAGLAQRGKEWMRLALLDGDRVALGDFALMHGRQVVEEVRVPAAGAISVTARADRLDGDATGDSRQVVITISPAARVLTTLTIDDVPAPLTVTGVNTYSFQLPAGAHRFTLK
ncbi:MAG: hypothetical protein BWY76_01589 [bacterium ADurb.Bin429]|nr:MAG: hypothetical protein BWY76_01589 [bacterium ADurb.Bin429]